MTRKPEIIDVEFTSVEDPSSTSTQNSSPTNTVCAICGCESLDKDAWIVTSKGKTIPLCDSCRFNRDVVGTLGKYALDLIGSLIMRRFGK